jgi:hypothetical protein
LASLPPRGDDVARGRDEFEAEDVAAGDAVLDGLAAAGVVGDVAADLAGLDAHRIAGEEEAVLLDEERQVVRDQAGLDRDREVREVEVDDVAHALERQDDAAEDGDGAAGEPGAGAARRDGDAFPVGQAHHRGDLLRGARKHDRFGRMGVLGDAGLVVAVGFESFPIHQDVLVAHDRAQFLHDDWGHGPVVHGAVLSRALGSETAASESRPCYAWLGERGRCGRWG